MTELEVTKLEGVGLPVPHLFAHLLAHPLDLGLGELVDVEGHVVEQGQAVGQEATVFVGPNLINQLGKFQHSTSSILMYRSNYSVTNI